MTARARGDHAFERRRFARPEVLDRAPTVIIVGAGASGTIAAVHLLRRGGTRVVLVDPAPPGLGVAYSTREERHLLNVPACGMSALAGDSGHFLAWCHGRGLPVSPGDYLPRRLYGEYLQSLLSTHGAQRLRIVRARALDVEESGGRVRVSLEDRSRLLGDAAIVAIGNGAPSRPPEIAELDPAAEALFVSDPWGPGAPARIAGAARIAVVGSGLTAVDIALTAAGASPAATVRAISRHGLLPREQLRDPQAAIALGLESGSGLDAVLGAVTDAIQRDPASWRAVIDGLRPRTVELWRGFTASEQTRFDRELRLWWDIHRHRMAPTVAATVASMRASGRLKVHGGGLRSVTAHAGGLRVTLVGGGHVDCDLLVNATGPRRGLDSPDNPLLSSMRAGGAAVPDELGIGLATSPDGALIAADGVPSRRIFTLGPPRRGELLESTAVPEIRRQADALAVLLDATADSRREQMSARVVV